MWVLIGRAASSFVIDRLRDQAGGYKVAPPCFILALLPKWNGKRRVYWAPCSNRLGTSKQEARRVQLVDGSSGFRIL